MQCAKKEKVQKWPLVEDMYAIFSFLFNLANVLVDLPMLWFKGEQLIRVGVNSQHSVRSCVLWA